MANFFDDPDDYSSEEPAEAPRKHPAARILGATVKYLFWGLILFINVLILWRLFSSGDPAGLKVVSANDALRAAYADYTSRVHDKDEVEFAVYQRENARMNITDKDPDEETGYLGNYGYFGITDQVLFPYAGQAQIVFRYNLSTLDHLKEDYGLATDPDPASDWYEVTLRVVMKDGSEKRLTPTETVKDKKSRYRYYKMSFEGIPELEEVSAIYADIYYLEDIDYTKRPYGDLCIYDSGYTLRPYKLDRKDRAALAG
ncbi:MAG: hypothetical protein ILP01_02720 [Clostridia bacterium]|nr:hypothetical protein [Clostridia bacterium]